MDVCLLDASTSHGIQQQEQIWHGHMWAISLSSGLKKTSQGTHMCACGLLPVVLRMPRRNLSYQVRYRSSTWYSSSTRYRVVESERAKEWSDLSSFMMLNMSVPWSNSFRTQSHHSSLSSICDIPSSPDGTSVFSFPRFRRPHVDTLLFFTQTQGNVTYLRLLLGRRFGIHKVHVMDQFGRIFHSFTLQMTISLSSFVPRQSNVTCQVVIFTVCSTMALWNVYLVTRTRRDFGGRG